MFRFGLFLIASHVFAATPVLEGFYPAGGARGSTSTVAAVGKSEVWPPRIWMDRPGLVFTAQTNKGRFSVAIAAEAAPGPRLVRLYNGKGASEPRIFVIGEAREMSDVEPNNHFARAQPAGDLPVTINGRLDKNGDVDSFAIDLRAGEWLEARVDSYTLSSKLDAVLRLVRTNGEQLAWNHDFITLDPRLAWRASEDQSVILQLFGFAHPPDSGITLAGGEGAVYRLHLGKTNQQPSFCDSFAQGVGGETSAKTGTLKLPAVVHGNISATEEDRFQFAVKKSEWISARIDAASLGSALDAWLSIEDDAGNPLLRSDDFEGSRDPRLDWKAPTNGTFTIVVGSVTHRGGPEYCYRLAVERAKPDFHANLGTGALELIPGGTNELKLELKRLRGFTGELAVAFRDLPPGVTSLTTNLPRKDGTVALLLTAAKNAGSFQGPVRLFVIETTTDRERAVPFLLTTPGETGFNHLLVESCDQFWLTVPAASAKEAKQSKK